MSEIIKNPNEITDTELHNVSGGTEDADEMRYDASMSDFNFKYDIPYWENDDTIVKNSELPSQSDE